MATTQRELWGAETRKAVANFPVSGEPIPAPVARWLGRIKAASARVRWPRLLGVPLLKDSRHDRSTFSSTVSRRGTRRATSPACRRCGVR